MPWTNRTYPVSMKNLPKEVREKAIEIANALLEQKKMEEGIAIATGISRAKDWAANRGKDTANKSGSRSADIKKHGEDRYVIPYKDHSWAVKKEKAVRVEESFDNKQEAIASARKKAREANASITIQTKSGKLQKRVSYNPRKRVQ